MIEIIGKAFDIGFAAVMCLLIFFKLLPRIDKMEKTVSKDSDNTETMTKSVDELKDVISNHLVHSVDELTQEIKRMNGKK